MKHKETISNNPISIIRWENKEQYMKILNYCCDKNKRIINF